LDIDKDQHDDVHRRWKVPFLWLVREQEQQAKYLQ
jgi:hypothetical protein